MSVLKLHFYFYSVCVIIIIIIIHYCHFKTLAGDFYVGKIKIVLLQSYLTTGKKTGTIKCLQLCYFQLIYQITNSATCTQTNTTLQYVHCILTQKAFCTTVWGSIRWLFLNPIVFVDQVQFYPSFKFDFFFYALRYYLNAICWKRVSWYWTKGVKKFWIIVHRIVSYWPQSFLYIVHEHIHLNWS